MAEYIVEIRNHGPLRDLIDLIMSRHRFGPMRRNGQDEFSPLIYEGEFGLGHHDLESMIKKQISEELKQEVNVTVTRKPKTD